MIHLNAKDGAIVAIPCENYDVLEEDVHEVTSWIGDDGNEHVMSLTIGHPLYDDGWYYQVDDTDIFAFISLENFDRGRL